MKFSSFAAGKRWQNVEWDKQKIKEALDGIDESGARNESIILFAALLRQCSNAKALTEGRRVHSYISKTGNDSQTFIGNLLMQMYGKCRCPNEAHRVFDKLHHPDRYSYNLLLAAYTGIGNLQHVTNIFQSLLQRDVVSWTIMLTAYGDNNRVMDAKKVFDEMPQRNQVAWNAMIMTYAQNGYWKQALLQFRLLDQDGIKPNDITLVNVISACSLPAAIESGRLIHQIVVEDGCQLETVVWTALLSMYGKCGSVKDAKKIFDEMLEGNTVSWSAMIAVYAQNDNNKQALDLFRRMDMEGMKPNEVTLMSALNACSSLTEARILHCNLQESKYIWQVKVRNALLNMYAKCGSLRDAKEIFDSMDHQKDLVSWSAMISAYAQCSEESVQAFNMFRLMDLEGISANEVTYIAVLDACANGGTLAQGRMIHATSKENGFDKDMVVGTALVNMYSKCGSLDDAYAVFSSLPQQDAITCNAIVTAFAQNGDGDTALQIFRTQELLGVKPSRVSFISVLNACRHAGFLKDGWQYFVSFKEDYEIAPEFFHYVCMLDLLGRAGELSDAEDLINSMPYEPDHTAWVTLLAACRSHGDVLRGGRVAQQVLLHDPQNSAAYVLLSNFYNLTNSLRMKTLVPLQGAASQIQIS